MKVLTLFFVLLVGILAMVRGQQPADCDMACQVNDCFRLPQPLHHSECPNGNRLDECGCADYTCQCAGCPDFDRNMPCPDGKKNDANGCPLSECDCSGLIPCDPPLYFCSHEQIASCPRGVRLNVCGCFESCQCEGCSDIDLSIDCPLGRISDQNGCPTNQCKPMTTQSPVKPGTCPWRVWGRRSCKVDTDCPGAEKCCRNNWNRTNMCVRPR